MSETSAAVSGSVTTLKAQYVLEVTSGNRVAGFKVASEDGVSSYFTVQADKFTIVNTSGQQGSLITPFKVDGTGVYMDNAYIRNLEASKIQAGNINVAVTMSAANVVGGTLDIGSGTFRVNSIGHMTASAAKITGDITATTGTIGGWTINSNRLTGGNVTLHSNGSITSSNAFFVSPVGALTASAAKITGDITANTGTVGGFTIATNLTSGAKTAFNDANTGVFIGTTGIGLGTQFNISAAGQVTASAAKITGDITATTGTIGGWSVTSNKLTGGNISLNAEGSITSSNNFFVSPVGALTASLAKITGDITANTGTIGGWSISSNRLIGGNVTLNSNGSITSSNAFFVSPVGALTASAAKITGDITANTGTIGGFTIATNLTTGTKTTYNDGNSGIFIGATGIGLGSAFNVSAAGAVNASNLTITGGSLNINNGAFSVNTLGHMTASAAKITGDITANAGTIGGFTIGTNLTNGSKTAYNDANSGIFIGATGIGLGSAFNVSAAGAVNATNMTISGGSLNINGGVFSVNSLGHMTASAAQITGKITSTSGTIGGFNIGSTSISNGKSTVSDSNAGVYVGTDGIALGANSTFRVSTTGQVTASAAKITGDITANTGTIGGFTIATNLTSGAKTAFNDANTGVFIGTTGIGLGTQFNVSAAGTVTASAAKITGDITSNTGTIGGWSITTGKLTGGNITLNSEGSITSSNNFFVSPVGAVTASLAKIIGDITANTGTIGGWTINSNRLTGGNLTLHSNGSITSSNAFFVSTVGAVTASAAKITGDITANTGTIGGFTIATNLTSGAKTAFNDANTGMFIGTTGIGLGTQFNVSAAGTVTASAAKITGDISATTGTIGGWTISSNRLVGGNVTLHSNGSISSSNAFFVSPVGALTASAAKISGEITSTAGTIGGFTLGQSSITNGKSSLTDANTGVYIGTDGIALGASNAFKVTTAGAVSATNLTVTGGSITGTTVTGNTISGGTISGATISGNTISGGSISGATISGNTISGGSISGVTLSGLTISGGTINVPGTSPKFSVNSSGDLTATSATITGTVTATGGSVGGWSIGATTLTGGSTTLNSNGTITCADLQASTGGKIGGWTIGSTTLTGGNITLSSSGNVYAGQTAYDTGTGWYLANDGKFSVGNSGGNKLLWDGTQLKVTGGIYVTDGIGVRHASSNATLTITGGTTNADGGQIDLTGTSSPSNPGVVSLKAIGASGFIQFYTNGAQRGFVQSNGLFDWKGSADFAGNMSVGASITLDGSSGAIAASSYNSTSSRRYKKNIKDLTNGLNLVNILRPVTFDWNNKDINNDIGMIAEEVYEVLPTIVHKNENGEIHGLEYGKLVAVLISAVKELSLELDEVKRQLKEINKV